MNPIRLEAVLWSELPALLKKYEAMIDHEAGGTSRLFGYASLITHHSNEKPESSRHIPDERARVMGMEVAMNVLAVGEREFRGTRGTYVDEEGKERKFANVGIYAGLEPAGRPEGFADGMAITVNPQDRRASLIAYMRRELGEPPQGLKLEDLFNEKAAPAFAALKGTPQDEFGMYKFQVVNADIDTAEGAKRVPAITVSTNEASRFAAIGLTPEQTAHLILDGQGYSRQLGDIRAGGLALDYFKENVMRPMRALGLRQERLEAIDAAVEKLAGVYAEANEIVAKKLPPEEEFEAMKPVVAALQGVSSPRFGHGDDVNARGPVSKKDRSLPENRMPHTAAEKFRRVAEWHRTGRTGRTI